MYDVNEFTSISVCCFVLLPFSQSASSPRLDGQSLEKLYRFSLHTYTLTFKLCVCARIEEVCVVVYSYFLTLAVSLSLFV